MRIDRFAFTAWKPSLALNSLSNRHSLDCCPCLRIMFSTNQERRASFHEQQTHRRRAQSLPDSALSVMLRSQGRLDSGEEGDTDGNALATLEGVRGDGGGELASAGGTSLNGRELHMHTVPDELHHLADATSASSHRRDRVSYFNARRSAQVVYLPRLFRSADCTSIAFVASLLTFIHS